MKLRVILLRGASQGEAAARILVQILSKHDLGARVAKKEGTSSSGIFSLNGEGVALICVSALDGGSPTYTRHVVRKLRRKIPEAKILVCYWMAGNLAVTAESIKADTIAKSLGAAAKYCLNLAHPYDKTGEEPAPAPDVVFRIAG